MIYISRIFILLHIVVKCLLYEFPLKILELILTQFFNVICFNQGSNEDFQAKYNLLNNF